MTSCTYKVPFNNVHFFKKKKLLLFTTCTNAFLLCLRSITTEQSSKQSSKTNKQTNTEQTDTNLYELDSTSTNPSFILTFIQKQSDSYRTLSCCLYDSKGGVYMEKIHPG